jgi:aryl-alcohol dehydrogenase-like predicted oxidoreductase
MRKRRLGRNGPNVSAVGLGCMSLGIADTYTSSVRSDDDLERIEEIAPRGTVSGQRYDPAMLGLTNR